MSNSSHHLLKKYDKYLTYSSPTLSILIFFYKDRPSVTFNFTIYQTSLFFLDDYKIYITFC